jgi:RNA polymerase sigma-70 factor (ECF subfamily)
MPELSQAHAHDVALHLLVLRCQAGDERAFGQLMERFGDRTLAYLRGLVGQDAEDVQQEVWLTVYRSVRFVVNPGAFRTWLFQTTRHRALDYLRRRKREAELIDGTVTESLDDVAAEEELDDARIDASTLESGLAVLPPPQREVLLLRCRDELSYAEIATVVGCPIGTVRTRLYHAKKRLQAFFQRGTI